MVFSLRDNIVLRLTKDYRKIIRFLSAKNCHLGRFTYTDSSEMKGQTNYRTLLIILVEERWECSRDSSTVSYTSRLNSTWTQEPLSGLCRTVWPTVCRSSSTPSCQLLDVTRTSVRSSQRSRDKSLDYMVVRLLLQILEVSRHGCVSVCVWFCVCVSVSTTSVSYPLRGSLRSS